MPLSYYMHSFATVYAVVGTCIYALAWGMILAVGFKNGIKSFSLQFDMKTIFGIAVYIESILIALHYV